MLSTWDCRNREELILSATPRHDTQVGGGGSTLGWNPVRPTVLAAKSEGYTALPQHLQNLFPMLWV